MDAKTIIQEGSADRIVNLHGEIDDYTIHTTIHELLQFGGANDEPIQLRVTSPGGSVVAGFALIDSMRHVTAPIFSIAIGMVASMAAVILAAGEPGYRYALPHARILLHPAFTRASGQLTQVQAATELHREFEREIEDVLLETTTVTRTRLRGIIRSERHLSAAEAKEIGLIDHII